MAVRTHRRTGEERGGPVRSLARPRDARAFAAIRHLEQAVLGADWTEGIVLRYGAFYGPGTSMAAGRRSRSSWCASASSRWSATAAGVWSFIHVADAAEATVAAVDRGSRGVYNVVDDDPAPVAEWLPALAQELGAKTPMRVPRFIGRLFAGEAGVGDDDRASAAHRTPRPSASSSGARRTRAGARVHDDALSRRNAPSHRAPRVGVRRPARDRSRATARRAAAGRVRDRLPDARQRVRGRGRRPGSAAAGSIRRSTPASRSRRRARSWRP